MITPEFGTPTSFDDADRAVSVPTQKLQSSKVFFSITHTAKRSSYPVKRFPRFLKKNLCDNF